MTVQRKIPTAPLKVDSKESVQGKIHTNTFHYFWVETGFHPGGVQNDFSVSLQGERGCLELRQNKQRVGREGNSQVCGNGGEKLDPFPEWGLGTCGKGQKR